MKVICFISGLLRTFHETLFPFLCKVAEDVELEVYISTTDDTRDTKFTSENYNTHLQKIMKHPICKVCSVHNISPCDTLQITQREKNTLYQWYHLWRCFEGYNVSRLSDNDILVRLRPDIRINMTPHEFIEYIKSVHIYDGIYIPRGSDIFSKEFYRYTNACINDQVAFGLYKYMSKYCMLYTSLNLCDIQTPIISEALLFEHLMLQKIPVKRIDFFYTLCLAECKLVAITGDSGVGKSTLTEALRSIFPFDSNLVLETDRYHKWERGNEQWNTVTHLHPEANFLEKIQDDTFMLKMGQQIQQVDYDHATGKFTAPETIDSKNYMFLCGLHTLYKEELRAVSDLKIYIDTDLPLKRVWKIQRDMKKRGYTFEKCVEIFDKRQEDYKKYIHPQMNYADIIIHYSTNSYIPPIFSAETIPLTVDCTVEISEAVVPFVEAFLTRVSNDVYLSKNPHMKCFVLNPHVDKVAIYTEYMDKSYQRFIGFSKYLCNLNDSYLGILQVMLVQILMDPTKGTTYLKGPLEIG
jgi:uridine kinase